MVILTPLLQSPFLLRHSFNVQDYTGEYEIGGNGFNIERHES